MASTIKKANAINVAPGISTAGKRIVWATFSTATGNVLIDARNLKSDKMVFLFSGHTTLPQRYWVGTSDSRATGSSFTYPHSAGKKGRLLITVPRSTKTSASAPESFYTFTTANALRGSICMVGPVETARFKDSREYIKICRGRAPGGTASHSTTSYRVAAILI